MSFISGSYDQSYVVEYTINSASTWEKKTVTLDFDYSAGTWAYTNGIGVSIFWTIACGTDYQGVADTWNSANDMATSNQVNGVDSTDNNFWLAQVQLELGSVATDFEYRQIGDELARCQRYYERYQNTTGARVVLAHGFSTATTSSFVGLKYTTQKRATPTFSWDGGATWNIYDSSAAVTPTVMTAAHIDINSCQLTITHPGYTANRPVAMYPTAAAAYLAFSAEL